MDLLKNKKIIAAIIVTVLFIVLFVVLIMNNYNNTKNTNVEKQTAEIYNGAPRSTLSGDKSIDLYYLVTDVEHSYLQYALGDFFHNVLQQSDLQNTVVIINAEQTYDINQDIIIFSFKQDDSATYTAKIIRPLSGNSVTRFVIENQNFDVDLAKYKYEI